MSTLDPLITVDVDLYELLNVDTTAKDADLKRAYRKVALKFHPDKNPSADAAEKFHFLSIALETLTTPSLKRRYDQLRSARLETLQRTAKLDNERRKMKEDLEAREAAAAGESMARSQQKRKIEVLKEEGKKMRKMRDDGLMSKSETDSAAASKPDPTEEESAIDEGERMVLLKWKQPPDADPITEAKLESLLSSFGSIELLRFRKTSSRSPERKSATILFRQRSAAQTCAVLLADPAAFASKDPFYLTIKSVSYRSDSLQQGPEDSASNTSTPTTPLESPAQQPAANISIAEKLAALRSRIKAQRS